MWLKDLEEPPRSGCLAEFVTGPVLEGMVCAAIFLNCAFMVYATDVEIQNLGSSIQFLSIGNWFFQVVYTIELTMKLVVHRQWFFWNDSWKWNAFDCALVIAGFVTLSQGNSPAGAWRILRLLRIGRAMKALRIMSHLKQLNALLTCLHGSLSGLFWSLLMLFIVYALFSLFLMQIIIGHLEETGDSLEDSNFHALFASVEESVLTLYKASTGGDDWSVAYSVIEETGFWGSATYLSFVAFVQFALINIITGIFVESAMSVLTLNPEMLAMEHNRKELENATKLEQLCIRVDADESGKLTQDEFEDSLRKKQLPMLLTMLGLPQHHVVELFRHMALDADDRKVEIGAFVKGCMLLKGAATNFDLHMLQSEFRDAHAHHQKDLDDILELLQDVLEPRASSTPPTSPHLAV
jgi:hypothetical protein